MTKIIIVAAVIALVGAAACVGARAPLVRGVDAGGKTGLVSNALPAMAVVPAPGFQLTASGVADTSVSMQGAAMGGASARVWYALNAADGPRQLVSSLADVDNNWEWSLNPSFTERRGLRVLHEAEASKAGASLSTFTYIRPAAKDPWMPAFLAAGQGWEGDVLLRQYTWWTVANHTKIMVEYREPVPQGTPLEFDQAALWAFEKRADAAFELLRKEQGDTLPADVARARADTAGISPRLLSAVLGEVMPGLRLRINED